MQQSGQPAYWDPWSFRFNDDEKHLYILTKTARGSLVDFQSIIPIPRGKALSSVTVSCEWQDQGRFRGDSKGSLGVILLLRGGYDATAANEEPGMRPWPLVPQTSSRELYSLARWGVHRIRGHRRERDRQLARFSDGDWMVEGSEVDLFGVVGTHRSAVRADLDGQSSAEFDEKILQR